MQTQAAADNDPFTRPRGEYCLARVQLLRGRPASALRGVQRLEGEDQVAARHDELVKQVAAELGISIKTVEKHRQHLMDKLDIHDTAGLTRYAIAAGVVESSVQKTIL